MRTVRKGVFETNSSSCHTITIQKNRRGIYDYFLPLSHNGYYTPNWGSGYNFACVPPTEYREFNAKLEYMLCMALTLFNDRVYDEKYRINKVQDIVKIPDIVKITNVVRKYVNNFKGFKIDPQYFYTWETYNTTTWHPRHGIDHQATDDYVDLNDWLKSHKISLENFLFNPYVALHIDMD